jgi:hypothetical protein
MNRILLVGFCFLVLLSFASALIDSAGFVPELDETRNSCLYSFFEGGEEISIGGFAPSKEIISSLALHTAEEEAISDW